MAATFAWVERNGASPGSATEGVANVNWKAIDDNSTVYTDPAAVIAAGTNSYTKWQYGKFSGTFNTISNLTYSHQTGALGTGVSLYGPKSMTADSDRLAYSTPSRTADNTNITPVNMTATSTSVTVYVGPTGAGDGPGSSGKAASATKPGGDGFLWTNYLTTQLQTTGSASPGDITQVTMRLQYDES